MDTTLETQAERDAYMAGQEWGIKKTLEKIKLKKITADGVILDIGKKTYSDIFEIAEAIAESYNEAVYDLEELKKQCDSKDTKNS